MVCRRCRPPPRPLRPGAPQISACRALKNGMARARGRSRPAVSESRASARPSPRGRRTDDSRRTPLLLLGAAGSRHRTAAIFSQPGKGARPARAGRREARRAGCVARARLQGLRRWSREAEAASVADPTAPAPESCRDDPLPASPGPAAPLLAAPALLAARIRRAAAHRAVSPLPQAACPSGVAPAPTLRAKPAVFVPRFSHPQARGRRGGQAPKVGGAPKPRPKPGVEHWCPLQGSRRNSRAGSPPPPLGSWGSVGGRALRWVFSAQRPPPPGLTGVQSKEEKPLGPPRSVRLAGQPPPTSRKGRRRKASGLETT